ncbi:hypothetical protein BS47DRAFT_1373557 [Hydnum rufescens UP504]|uniref:DDE-1 domain-containing protein n=1 Tax=Hydnum rufescens UP504 TaxID=1448309 RepID=A0A9P6APS4_9AGAM|nr:hypothetical protein BS47DRAFT_1373557 [Hydnum rufescens UP504]
MRTTTQASQKLPDDWEKQCEDAILRLSYNIKLFNIPAELVINADQTGVCLVPAGNKTWAPVGAKQVAAMAKEEKRQFTLMVATSVAGEVVPFQSIHKGKTGVSLPSQESHAEGEKMGILWTPGGPTHWSSISSMKVWVDKVLEPHIQHKSILLIDVWSVHCSEEFTEWMKDKHPNIKIGFIPGGCMCSLSWFDDIS